MTLKSLTLPAGSYVVMARTMIGTLGTADAACDLHSQGSQIDTTWLGATSSSSELPVSLVGTVELSTGSEKIDLDCRSYQPNASANGSNIIAIKAAAVTGS